MNAKMLKTENKYDIWRSERKAVDVRKLVEWEGCHGTMLTSCRITRAARGVRVLFQHTCRTTLPAGAGGGVKGLGCLARSAGIFSS